MAELGTQPRSENVGTLLFYRAKNVLLGPYVAGSKLKGASMASRVALLTSYAVLINFGLLLFLFWFVGHSFWIALLLAFLVVGGQIAAGYFMGGRA